ncbi:MAG: glycogen/starch/alpha-glucan phosphorylase [Victivallales bacterium]|nr:glycogen/starch/alpha-glucan phosphorylase [Victivallales bacterium]
MNDSNHHSPLPDKADYIRQEYDWHMLHTQAASGSKRTPLDHYLSFCYTIRDALAKNWMDTQNAYSDNKVRRIYYLSLEFLIGRLLGNNAINLKLDQACRQALEGSEFDWDAIQELERDAGLGNGGLGRLAACFLDSAATLDLPCQGYGLRYDYGIFKQLIVNGEQMEEPDIWKSEGYPWEIRRPAYKAHVCFGGETRQIEQGDKAVWRWYPVERLCGIPYDIPIVGFGGKTINNLRLWSATTDNEFDFQNFNKGSYFEAVEKQVHASNLTKVLYPNDNIEAGKELRLRQQYFFVSCTLQDIIRRHEKENGTLENLPDKVFIQLNDTHPALVVPELMRILVDEKEMDWDKAWEFTKACTGYTNHTVLPEALEKWSVPMFSRLLPRHIQIIYEINGRFLHEVSYHFPGDVTKLQKMSIIEEGGEQKVRMAHLVLVGCSAVNGVAQIHSDILKTTVFPEFAQIWPEKFQNKTNGITQRRWLLLANPGLSRLITDRIGDGWITDLCQMRKLEEFLDDDAFLDEFARIKRENKVRLAQIIESTLGTEVSPDSLFDVQIKRLHEYKRQLLLVLYIIILYNRLSQDPDLPMVPRTFIFGAKAAPGYAMAKLIIQLIHGVAKVVNHHPQVSKKLRVVFLPDYRVSLAEKIIPAADLSEQISLAGTEASGTGNMKLMLNGAITIGTEDGANVEIHKEVGDDNIFIFGMTAEEVTERRKSYSPWDIYHSDREIQLALDSLRKNVFSLLTPGLFEPIIRSLLDFGDHYMLLADLRSYIEAQDRVNALYQDKREWNRRAIINVARSGKFSSDRTIAE